MNVFRNDIKYYKQGTMSNETLILKYGNRCTGKEYKEQNKNEHIQARNARKKE